MSGLRQMGAGIATGVTEMAFPSAHEGSERGVRHFLTLLLREQSGLGASLFFWRPGVQFSGGPGRGEKAFGGLLAPQCHGCECAVFVVRQFRFAELARAGIIDAGLRPAALRWVGLRSEASVRRGPRPCDCPARRPGGDASCCGLCWAVFRPLAGTTLRRAGVLSPRRVSG